MNRKTNKYKTLGEAATEFVQGGNQAQTFILIVIVGVVALFLLSNVPTLLNALIKKNDPPAPAPTPAAEEKTKVKEEKTSVQPTTETANIPPNGSPEAIKMLQRLLNAAGFNAGAVDGLYYDRFGRPGTTDAALQAYARSIGKNTAGVQMSEWIILLRKATGQTGLQGLKGLSNVSRQAIIL